MSTLNARVRRAWANVADNPTDVNYVFEHQRAAFESGYRARDWGLPTREQIAEAVERELLRQGADEFYDVPRLSRHLADVLALLTEPPR